MAKWEAAIAMPTLFTRLHPFVVADTKHLQSLALLFRHTHFCARETDYA